MNFSDIFTSASIYIGAITGIASLLLHFKQLWTERFALKIHFFENENMYFDKLDCCKNYRTKFQGISHVRFVNKSATPLTIYAMKMFVNGSEVSIEKFNETSFRLCSYLGSHNESEILEISMKNQIALPLRLEAYDSCDGMVFIPFFPSTDKLSLSIKLRVETAKGTRTKTSTIWNCNTVVDDGDGPYFQ